MGGSVRERCGRGGVPVAGEELIPSVGHQRPSAAERAHPTFVPWTRRAQISSTMVILYAPRESFEDRHIPESQHLRPYPGSRSLFEAWLPCRDGRWDPPVGANGHPFGGVSTRWSSSYLSYQDPAPHRSAMFKIDDSARFTCCDAYPRKHAHADQDRFPLHQSPC